MKGYTMVLYVNAALFLLLSLLTLAYGTGIQRQADHCQPPAPGTTGPDCQQFQDTAHAARRVSPYLLAIALALGAVALATSPPAKPKTPN